MLLLLPPVYRRWVRFIPPSLSGFTQQIKIPSLVLYPLLLLFISLGAIRYIIAQPVIDPSFVSYYNNQTTELILDGVLVDQPDRRETYTNVRLRIEQLSLKGDNNFIPVHGLLLARISPNTAFRYGDRIRLQGHLETPPENEDFSYRDYLASQRIYSYIAFPTASVLQNGQGSVIMSTLYSFQQRALDVVYRLFPDPEASLIRD
jgi:hypothetical protein